jgi:hypothetical protein
VALGRAKTLALKRLLLAAAPARRRLVRGMPIASPRLRLVMPSE